MKKTCPKCSSKAVKLYIHQTINDKRKWIPTSWFCTSCNFIYRVVSDTLLFKCGEVVEHDKLQKKCPKCEKKLIHIYRHKNPKHGKQEWITIGLYCDRCKYTWIKIDDNYNQNG